MCTHNHIISIYSKIFHIIINGFKSLSNRSDSGSLDVNGKTSIDFTVGRTESHIDFRAL